MTKYIVAALLLLAAAAFGQAQCDVNHDGYGLTVADLIFLMDMLNAPPRYHVYMRRLLRS